MEHLGFLVASLRAMNKCKVVHRHERIRVICTQMLLHSNQCSHMECLSGFVPPLRLFSLTTSGFSLTVGPPSEFFGSFHRDLVCNIYYNIPKNLTYDISTLQFILHTLVRTTSNLYPTCLMFKQTAASLLSQQTLALYQTSHRAR